MTSELANLVLLHRTPHVFGGAPRNRPTGYHGYGVAVRVQARAFLDRVEGAGQDPGHATMQSYFGGSVSLVIRPSNPRLSTLIVHRHRLVLDALFT